MIKVAQMQSVALGGVEFLLVGGLPAEAQWRVRHVTAEIPFCCG